MTSVDLTVRSSPSPNPGPHRVKQWQLSGTDYQPQPALTHRSSVTGTADSRFSAWTPITNKTSNHQLFEERTTLVLHWFDLWTDRQRKVFLQALLSQCSNSQLKSCRDWLKQIVPVTSMDFTSVLPRFLSLYVMSFLTPRDLCSAAQVSWHWRVLAEQDCLWSVRCVRRGWFLPYNPGDREYGGWKSHYVSCVSTLDWLTPREAAQTYGTLNMPCSGERKEEEEEERRKERRIRQTIRERVEEQKRASLKSRPAWRSSINRSRPGGTVVSHTQGERQVPGRTRSVQCSPSWLSDRTGRLCLSPDLSLNLTPTLTLEKTQLSSHVRSQAMGDSVNRGGLSTSTSSRPRPSLSPSPPLLLLLSNRIPAYELVLCGVRVGVVVVLYDHRGTLQALLSQAERALGGQRAQRLGVLAPGGTEEITLLQGCKVTERSVLTPDSREFWEKLCGWVVPPEEGGGVDVFCPLAASARGVLLVQSLSTLTGLEVSAPTGMATGSFQNILSEWSCSNGAGDRAGSGVRGVCASPGQHYVCEGVLQGWSWQTQWLEEALGALRDHLGPQLPQLSLDTRGRVLGQFLWEAVALEDLSVSKEVTVALTEGLTALATETRPLEFLSLFLRRWGEKRKDLNGGGEEGDERRGGGGERTEGGGERREGGGERSSVFLTERGTHRLHSPNPEIHQEWRGVVVRELYMSECVYVRRLESVKRVYHDPLLSALQSNRAILSSAHISMVFTPLTHILDINRLFLSELGPRLQQWEAGQCVGDVCVKFCSKLRVYTNYLNNYPTALLTIDKCREMNPAFRAFLKRHDRTLETHMLSLQELLLCPVWRLEEYVTLLQALSLHTLSQHSDHTQLSGVVDTLTRYRDFIRKLKRNSEKAMRMQETQRMIRGCPNLCEGSRQLITTQDAALLKCPSDDITASLRMYEHVSDVGLFLFNDAMVLTERCVCHRPFTHTHCNTHTFLASVALHSLTLREITDTRYVCNGFVLEGPSRVWVCATEREEDKERFLCTLRSAIHTAITET
ncbi:epithelial cell-transforming sequence 2 oncogene-like [Coregonus clupeaformis]|uniref:epithelial cell-transforming sequence 2 oncogene-like n=1 Tax=Coregonus clupeaformis TaxID=59861 RepID=UPI001BE0C64F|nr:epithelial cell-transforming sequence 2 oncogene-like [Coregonus clupeaformis]